jgi:hypothetical protein
MNTMELLITIVVITIGAVDFVIVLLNRGADNTLSALLRKTPLRHPLISFTFGYICGHVFGYMKEPANVVVDYLITMVTR